MLFKAGAVRPNCVTHHFFGLFERFSLRNTARESRNTSYIASLFGFLEDNREL